MIVIKECIPEDGALVHTCDACPAPEMGNIRSFALIKAGTTIPTVPTLEAWTALVESGDVIIIPESSGTFDGGTPKMGVGYGDEKERLLGHDYVLDVKDPTYAANSPFWGAVEQEKDKWNLAWRTETQLAYVDAKATITAKAPVTADIEAEVVWEVQAKWFSKKKPVLADITPIKSLFACYEISA